MSLSAFNQKSWLNTIAEQLSQLLEQQRLPHGMLFSGHSGSGCGELAHWLAQQLLCTENGLWGPACGHCKGCGLLKAGNHPDIVRVEAEKSHIGVENIRHANQFLMKKAQLGQAKVVIIEQAELMTEAAANALLKTLEEPTPYSFLILTSSDSDRLLATIQSRCTRFDIRPPVGQGLKQSVGASSLLDDYSNMSHLGQLQDQEVAQQFEDFEETFTKWLDAPLQSQQLVSLLTEHDSAMAWLMQQFTAASRASCQWQGVRETRGVKVLSSYPNELLFQAMALINQASQQLKQLSQANKKFVIESLVIDLLKLIGNNAEKRAR